MIVVADTSPLTNLAVIGRLELLRDLYGDVVIPESVAAEIRAGEERNAYGAFLDSAKWIGVQSAIDRRLVDELAGALDRGEAEAIALALELGADLLLNERAGRRAASDKGIRTVGLLGTLLACKSRGLVPAVRPIVDDLRLKAGFWMSRELYDAILQRAGEA